jgi:hypothetical protein
MPLPPRADLVNVLEYEAPAKAALAPDVFPRIAGGDRTPFDRMTLRHRVMVPARHLDLGVALFGDTIVAPIIAGPRRAAWHASRCGLAVPRRRDRRVCWRSGLLSR